MKVIVCDDDGLWLERAQEIITQYGKEHNLELQVAIYKNREELFAETNEVPEILFMDIELETENGIDLVKKINREWPECEVVYLTNYLYYATDVYTTEHSYFVLKNQFEDRIDSVFEKLLKKIKQKHKTIVFDTIGGGEMIINLKEIMYFERQGRKTKLTTSRTQVYLWDKLDTIVERIAEKGLLRCHNSYLIHLPAVEEYRRNSFLMQDGKIIDISRSYIKTVEDAFGQWVLEESI